jgi:periplasmic divalent cation tolerance protein
MIVVLCTAPDRKSASAIAKALVEAGLAACVNVMKAGESVYMWEGKLVREPEHLLVIKAKESSWEKLKKKIESIHPYSVPEIVSLQAGKASEPYLDWVYGGAKRAAKK